MQDIIEVKGLIEMNGAIDPQKLELLHRECGRLTLHRDRPDHSCCLWEIACNSCQKRWTLTDDGLKEIMYTAIDQVKERSLKDFITCGALSCAVSPRQ